MLLTSSSLIPLNSYRTLVYQRLIYGVLITLFSLGWLSGPALAGADANDSPGAPGVKGGIVTTSEPLATQVGAGILRKGATLSTPPPPSSSRSMWSNPSHQALAAAAL